VTIVLLFIVIVASAIIVRVGAFALELTGMPWEHAKFQSLSAFSTTGFTTRESEQVPQHPVRRRIVGTLIILGNAGIVTTIGTLAGTISQMSFEDDWPAIAVALAGLVVAKLLTRWKRLMVGVRHLCQSVLSRHYDFQAPRADELLRLDQGYDLARIELTEKSPVVGKTLIELGLKSWIVQVLAIERGPEYKPVPRGQEKLLVGDCLIVYGADDAIRKVFKAKKTRRLTIMSNA
jgi:hypothetical protein